MFFIGRIVEAAKLYAGWCLVCALVVLRDSGQGCLIDLRKIGDKRCSLVKVNGHVLPKIDGTRATEEDKR